MLPLCVHAHTEHEKARYVAVGGLDHGRCDSLATPCASVSYAAQMANKGDKILIATGDYAIQSAEDVFYLSSGLLDVQPGFDRYDLFQRQDTVSNPVTLLGVPPAFRDRLQARGFQVIADAKALSSRERKRSASMQASLEAMQVIQSNAPCNGGLADGLTCDKVDLLSHLPLNALSLNPSEANDIWGFIDLNTHAEYAIIGVRNGFAVIDVSDPFVPVEIAAFNASPTVWRDIKIYQYYDQGADRFRALAYITADNVQDRIQVIDLSGLPNSVELLAQTGDFQAAHNVFLANVDYATGLPLPGTKARLQISGANSNGGSLRDYALDQPETPTLNSVTNAGYIHDAAGLRIRDARATTQCQSGTVVCQVIADFNETTVELWDIGDESTPLLLSSTPYPNASYTHSGWPTEDQRFLFVHDELDEQQRGLPTTVRVLSLDDLSAPALSGVWSGPTNAIDHNGFVRGNRYYMSNYTRGLTILDITDPNNPVTAGFLDTFGPTNSSSFSGAWGAYPFLPSGTIAISDIDSGLYLVRDQTRVQPAGQFEILSAHAGSTEGNDIVWQVERRGGTTGGVSVDYSFLPASASTGDIVAAEGTLTWADGQAGTQAIRLSSVSDTIVEPVESIRLSLVNPTGGATLGETNVASGYLSDVGASSSIAFFESTMSFEEGSAQATFVVQRQGSASGEISVNYQFGGSATNGEDYQVSNPSGELRWENGDASPRNLRVALLDDSVDEADEEIVLTLDSPQSASLAESSATLSIRDNDTTVTPPVSPPVTGSSSGGGGSVAYSVTTALLLVTLSSALRRRRYRGE